MGDSIEFNKKSLWLENGGLKKGSDSYLTVPQSCNSMGDVIKKTKHELTLQLFEECLYL